MSITTEEAEIFAAKCSVLGMANSAAALRSLAAERDALRAEAERLKAGGCARDHGLVMHLDAGNAASYPGIVTNGLTTWTDLSGKGTTQFCADAVALKAENARMKEVLERLARLGNGPHYGNSDGNMIARAELERLSRAGGKK